MRLKLIPDDTKIDFMGFRRIAVAFSIVLIVASLAVTALQGLNFGIDFKGGIMIEARTEGPADVGAIRSAVSDLGLGDVAVQGFGAPQDVLIRIGVQEGDGNAQMQVVGQVEAALQEAIGGIETRRVEVVGPKVSGELVQQGALAVGLAVFFMLIYIWLRFEWQFALGAVIALVHDVVLTIGVFSVTSLEFNLSIIAALLTIVGYSLNDTVIVFDQLFLR